jgi:Ca-activated chloride channel family protein
MSHRGRKLPDADRRSAHCMNETHPLSFALRSDGRLLTPGLPEARTLLLDLVGAAGAADLPHAPLAVMLAVDVSGSMSGAKLAAVREACDRVVAALDARDLLGVCAFDSAASMRLPLTAMDASGRGAAIAAIQDLMAGDTTALCDGWRLAADALAAEDARLAGRSLHVVLLSDGMGNVGVTDPEALAEFASATALRGIGTSAIGVGDDWSSDQLEALALAGGGRLHHALRADEIAALLEGELRGMQRLAATAVEVALALPAGFLAQPLTPERARGADGVLRIRLGALPRGGRRTLAIRVLAEVAAGAGPWAFEAAVTAQDPATRRPLPPLHATLRLDRADDDAAARAARDPAAVAEVAEHWLADATRRVMTQNRDGRADRDAFVREAADFSHYARGVAAAEALAVTCSRLAEQSARRWEESERKLAQMAAFKQSRGEAVYASRASLRACLDGQLVDDADANGPRTG